MGETPNMLQGPAQHQDLGGRAVYQVVCRAVGTIVKVCGDDKILSSDTRRGEPKTKRFITLLGRSDVGILKVGNFAKRKCIDCGSGCGCKIRSVF